MSEFRICHAAYTNALMFKNRMHAMPSQMEPAFFHKHLVFRLSLLLSIFFGKVVVFSEWIMRSSLSEMEQWHIFHEFLMDVDTDVMADAMNCWKIITGSFYSLVVVSLA